MTAAYDAILLIAFGGPTSPADIRPFLDRITQGMPITPQRIEEVVHHYEIVGGKSPLNEITFRQARSLAKVFESAGFQIPVYVGMRNAAPFFVDTLKQMRNDRVAKALGLILSSHHTEASWDRYQQNIADARAELGGDAPIIEFCQGWHDHPLFIQTWVELIEASFAKIPADRRQTIPLIFTAHSLPLSMAEKSPYVAQLQTTARLIANRLSHSRWSLAYQSRSGRPRDPWLEPDIGTAIGTVADQKCGDLIVAPIGFVCDHVEILYDLDVEAKKIAEGLSLRFHRASCPNDHPMFVRMMADVIEKRLIEDRG